MKNIFTLLLLLIVSILKAQSFSEECNQISLNYLTATLPEKIYLQTDKPYYAVEDTVWLKAFLVNAQINKPSPSNYVYVELINRMDSVEKRIKIRKDSIGFQGYLKLDKELVPGEYALRAYTNWMRNESPEYFFQKNLAIGRITSTPKVLTVEYKKNEGDKVRAIARYTYSDGSPIKDCRIDFFYEKDGKKYQKKYGSTNAKGEMELGINLNEKGGEQKLTARVLNNKGIILHEQQFVIPRAGDDYDVQFFPESGTLLSGIPQIVAFKAVGSDGLGIPVSGTIVTQGGVAVAEIITAHNGMGKFPLFAQPDSTYYAIVKDNRGIQKKFKLPEVRKEAVALQLNRRGGSCIYSFENRTGYPSDSLFLIAHTRGMLSTVRQLNSVTKSGKFSLSKVPEGILNVAIVNQSGDVFCERMMFVKRGTPLIPQVIADSADYGQRSLVELTINAPQGDYALSVTDAEVVKWDSLENNIVSQLLLKSELRGYIERPGYYFTADNPEVNGRLDLLMLTQGWRRYDFSSILKGNIPEMKEPMELGQALTGRVKPVVRWKNMEGVEVVGFSDKWKPIRAKLDTTGVYTFDGIEFPDSTAFTINAVNKKGKARGVVIYPDPERFPDSRVFIPNPRPAEQVKKKEELQKYKDVYRQSDIWREVMLDNVDVTAKYISKTGKLAGEFAAHADYVITDQKLEIEFKNKSLWDVVRDNIIEKIPGINKLTEDTYTYRGEELRFVVDMRLIEAKDLSNYILNEVASISFFRDAKDVPIYVPNTPFVQGAEWMTSSEIKSEPVFDFSGGVSFKDKMEEGWGASSLASAGWDERDLQIYTAEMSKYKGVILIELKNGGTAHYFRPSLGLATLYPLGYQKPAEFYSPRYDIPDSLKQDKTDYRTTVYWNPKIQTNETGKTEVSFYTTDMPHDMEYVLEGITKKGVPCRKVGKIPVRKE